MTYYHIDTDMGVDDGLALLVADRLLPRIHALSTVYGNAPLATATRNALIFRELLGGDACWPVFKGADRSSDDFRHHAPNVHGEDGLGGATSSVEPALLNRVSLAHVDGIERLVPPANSESMTIIGLGPATNIPRLVSRFGRETVKEIVLMSGSFFDRGNITVTAEFNAYCDPPALQATLDLGIPVTLVPLDVCRKVQLLRSTVQAYATSDPSAVMKLVIASHMSYMDSYQATEHIDGCFPHDTITVLVALEPERFFHISGSIKVERDAFHRGQTRIVLGKSHVRVVTGGDLAWVREILSRSPHSRPSTHAPLTPPRARAEKA
jgi:inosine-uridine nucleoside N-ribohydrolase